MSDNTRKLDAEAYTYVAIVLTFLVGNANASLKPVLISSYVEFLGYGASLAGYLLTIEAAATSAGITFGAAYVARWNRRRMIGASFALIVIGNLLALFIDRFVPLAIVRAFTGIGHGVAVSVALASIADLKNPDRMAAVMSLCNGAVSAALLVFVPMAQGSNGIQPVFLAMGIMAIALPLCMRSLPLASARTAAVQAAEDDGAFKHRMTILITLLAVCFFYISVGAFWPFTGQLGRAAGLSYEGAARVTALGPLAAMAGSLVALAAGDRFGRAGPIGYSIGGAILGLILLILFPGQPIVVGTVVVVYIFCWAMVYPFVMGFASKLDPQGRVNGLIGSLSLVGFAIGPGLGGAIMTLGAPGTDGNLIHVIWLSAACLFPSFALVFAIRRYERTNEGRQAYANP